MEDKEFGYYLSKTISSQSSVNVSGFWYGKFLQSLSASNSSHSLKEDTMLLGQPIHVHVNIAKTCLRQCYTSLSPHVHSIVTQSLLCNHSSHDDDLCCLDDDLTLQWSMLQDSLNPLTSEFPINAILSLNCNLEVKHLNLAYSELVQQLRPFAINVHQTISSQEKEKVIEKWIPFLQWTHSPKIFKECYQLLFTDVHLSLTLMTAAIERSLGDVYLYVSKAPHCPRHMKDLLSTEELSLLFGEIPVLCLKILIGPPGGLNLRNVLWHGFAAKNEIPTAYAYLLLTIIVSIGKLLLNISSFPSSTLSHRPFVTFHQETLIKGVFPEYTRQEDIDQVLKLFKDTYFILPSMLPIWESALEYYKRGSYGYCLSLLLPALEHSLRRVYACCNNCPDRILTAESEALYTTLDEILSPTLFDGTTSNELMNEIGDQNMEMLLDLLVYPEGPKLRDKISHGEVELSTMNITLANHVLNMCVIYCLRYSLSYHPLQDSIIHRTKEIGMKYVSLFHPHSLLHRELVHLVSEMGQWEKMRSFTSTENNSEENILILSTTPHPNYTTALSYLSDSFPCLHVSLSDVECFHVNHLHSSISTVWGSVFKTLFMSKEKLEVIGILRRITEHTLNGIQQVLTTSLDRYQLHQEKELRSRQRTNFDRLLSCIGVYWCASVFVCYQVCLVIALLHEASHDRIHNRSTVKLIKCLKKVLRFCENFSSQTSQVKNRWDEAHKLCSDYIEDYLTITQIIYAELT